MTTRSAGQALTRERILEAAGRLYLSRPYDDVTLKDVARVAAVSVPTVLLHFGTKDRMLTELIKVAGPREDVLRETTPNDVGEAARVIAARYEATGRAVLRMLAIEDRFPVLAQALAEGRRRHRGWTERTFPAAIAARPAGPVRQRFIASLVAVFDIYTWHVLCQSLAAEDTVLAMGDMASRLIGSDTHERSGS